MLRIIWKLSYGNSTCIAVDDDRLWNYRRLRQWLLIAVNEVGCVISLTTCDGHTGMETSSLWCDEKSPKLQSPSIGYGRLVGFESRLELSVCNTKSGSRHFVEYLNLHFKHWNLDLLFTCCVQVSGTVYGRSTLILSSLLTQNRTGTVCSKCSDCS